jgi:hypothetical protein
MRAALCFIPCRSSSSCWSAVRSDSPLKKRTLEFQSPNALQTTLLGRAVHPTKFARLHFLLLFGAVVVAGIDAGAVQAFDAVVINTRAPGHPWCVTHEGTHAPSACEYDNLLTCGVAAIVARGSCKGRLSLPVTAGAAPLLRSRKLSAAKPPLQKRVSAPISGNDELFQKFVRWSSETQLSEARSTTVVVSADPGAVATSAGPALSEAEPAKPEPVASKPSVNGQWLIQIGAFDGEAEARQHLSVAQLKAGTALAAADPFTERVQTGVRVLYRARFAGFDKEAAEIACKQLRRGQFECMTLKR